MDVRLLFKIPCLLLVTSGFHVAFSQPNSPSSPECCPPVPSFADKLVRVMLMAGTPHYLKVRTKRKFFASSHFSCSMQDVSVVFDIS